MSAAKAAPATGDRWLDLSEAAEYVGVHFTTLRRWADAGDVPCIRTPGGRRRFQAGDLDRFMEGLRQTARSLAMMPLESRALDIARQELKASYEQQGQVLAHFGEEQRARFKGSGQKLLGLLIQYSSRSDNGEAFLEEAKRLAADYGALCCQAGLSVTDTVKTFLFFGHSMLNTVQQAGALNGPHDEEGYRLYQRMNVFLEAVLLATVESYCRTPPPLLAEDHKG
jgi:excisionase family DNA binding protein